jgi:response regulator of citrate/malate metabolism
MVDIRRGRIGGSKEKAMDKLIAILDREQEKYLAKEKLNAENSSSSYRRYFSCSRSRMAISLSIAFSTALG